MPLQVIDWLICAFIGEWVTFVSYEFMDYYQFQFFGDFRVNEVRICLSLHFKYYKSIAYRYKILVVISSCKI